jgi:hypothetical protein
MAFGRVLFQVEQGTLGVVRVLRIVIVDEFPVSVPPGGEIAASVLVGEVVEEGVFVPRVFASAQDAPEKVSVFRIGGGKRNFGAGEQGQGGEVYRPTLKQTFLITPPFQVLRGYELI